MGCLLCQSAAENIDNHYSTNLFRHCFDYVLHRPLSVNPWLIRQIIKVIFPLRSFQSVFEQVHDHLPTKSDVINNKEFSLFFICVLTMGMIPLLLPQVKSNRIVLLR